MRPPFDNKGMTIIELSVVIALSSIAILLAGRSIQVIYTGYKRAEVAMVASEFRQIVRSRNICQWTPNFVAHQCATELINLYDGTNVAGKNATAIFPQNASKQILFGNHIVEIRCFDDDGAGGNPPNNNFKYDIRLLTTTNADGFINVYEDTPLICNSNQM